MESVMVSQQLVLMAKPAPLTVWLILFTESSTSSHCGTEAVFVLLAGSPPGVLSLQAGYQQGWKENFNQTAFRSRFIKKNWIWI